MRIDKASAEEIFGKYFNIIYYFFALLAWGQVYLEVSDSEKTKSWAILLPYLGSLIVMLALSKHLEGGKRKKVFIIMFTVIIPWLYLFFLIFFWLLGSSNI